MIDDLRQQAAERATLPPVAEEAPEPEVSEATAALSERAARRKLEAALVSNSLLRKELKKREEEATRMVAAAAAKEAGLRESSQKHEKAAKEAEKAAAEAKSLASTQRAHIQRLLRDGEAEKTEVEKTKAMEEKAKRAKAEAEAAKAAAHRAEARRGAVDLVHGHRVEREGVGALLREDGEAAQVLLLSDQRFFLLLTLHIQPQCQMT